MFPNPSANHPDANFPLGPSPQRTSTNKDRVCVFLILKTILEIQTKSSQPFLGCCNVIVLIIQNRNWEYDWWKLQRRPPICSISQTPTTGAGQTTKPTGHRYLTTVQLPAWCVRAPTVQSCMFSQKNLCCVTERKGGIYVFLLMNHVICVSTYLRAQPVVSRDISSWRTWQTVTSGPCS